MTARPYCRALGALVRHTFVQSLHSWVFWVLLAASLTAVAVCLTADVSSDREAVRTLEAQLAAWGADGAGLLLALFCTAGLLPASLHGGAAPLLLTRPLGRGWLLAGKVLGVLALVAFHAGVFLLSTWLALGLRTGVWTAAYLACLPLLVLHFAVFFSLSALLAVATRSTVACLFGSVLFWLACWAVNFGRHTVRLMEGGMTLGFGRPLEASYWLLPKPLDFHLVLVDSLHAGPWPGRGVDVAALAARGAWLPGPSLLASAACAAVLLALAAYELKSAEY
jgi:hypothetical protein